MVSPSPRSTLLNQTELPRRQHTRARARTRTRARARTRTRTRARARSNGAFCKFGRTRTVLEAAVPGLKLVWCLSWAVRRLIRKVQEQRLLLVGGAVRADDADGALRKGVRAVLPRTINTEESVCFIVFENKTAEQ